MTIPANDSTQPIAEGQFSALPRPPFQLNSLPIRYRWEVTRRHPYYQTFWKRARDSHYNLPLGDPFEPILREFAVLILEMIGFIGDPPDPATGFDALGGDALNAGWLSGAVTPMTLRGLAGLLIAFLPNEVLGQVGQLLIDAGREDNDDRYGTYAVLLELQRLKHETLDSYPDQPIVTITPTASSRQVNEAIGILLKGWKAERDLSDARDRSDKYEEYLQAWDLREGWCDGTYVRANEAKLTDVAARLHSSVGTINNQYRSAFDLIMGHPYSPEMWLRFMAPLKLFDLKAEPVGTVSSHRPLKNHSAIILPESALGGPSRETTQQGPATSAAADRADPEVFELVHDILALIERGHSDAEIVSRLNLSSSAIGAVTYLRTRGGDIA